MIKASRITALIIPAVMALMLTACSSGEKKNNSLISPPDTKGNPVEAFGTVEPRSTRIITTGITARLVRLNASEGQKIKRGDILAVLDLTEYKNGIARLEAERKAVERELTQLRQDCETSRKMLSEGSMPDLKRLSNSLAESKDTLTELQKSLELKKALYASGSIAQSELKDAEAQLKKAESSAKDIALSMESLKAAKQQELDIKASEMSVKADRLHALDNELAEARKKLDSDTIHEDRIVCNIEQGVVSGVSCMEGAVISPSEAVFKLMDTSRLIVEANVDEQFISMIEAGARVVIVPDADRTHLYTGRVDFISSAAVTANGETTVPVKISIDKGDSFLMPGLNVSVKIDSKAE